MTEDPLPFNAFMLNSRGDIMTGDITVGDIVGRDKIITNINTIQQRALTAAEAAEKARSLEIALLAKGVGAFTTRLQGRAKENAEPGKPYRGLLEYRLNDAELFFGRDQAIRELLQQIASGQLTILHAESGAGKTSLLQAGVAPYLIAASHLPLYLRPYDLRPDLAIRHAFISDLSTTPSLAGLPLKQFLRIVAAVLGKRSKLCILLDQFEEFFTQLVDAEREHFVRELAGCIEDTSLDVRWVLSLRTEYFGSLAAFRPRIRNPFANDYRLNRFSRTEARTVIVEPVQQRGVQFEARLIDRLLDDLGGNEIAPAQLQLVCAALHADLSPGETIISSVLYEREGGTAGILRGHLARVLNRDLPREDRSTARRLLEALVTADARRIVRAQSALIDDVVTSEVSHVAVERTRMASRKITLTTTTTVNSFLVALYTMLVDGKGQPGIMRVCIR